MDCLTKLVLAFFFFSPTRMICMGEPKVYYLNNLQSSRNLDIELCPADASSLAGSLVLTPSGQWYNVTAVNKTIDIAISLSNTPSCQVPDHSFGLYLSFRSFHIASDGSPAYTVDVENSFQSNRIRVPDLAKLDYTSPGFRSYPRSEAQYYTGLQPKLMVFISLELQRPSFDGINEPVVLDFVVATGILPGQNYTANNDHTYCEVLNGWIPTEVYCLKATTGFLSCPQNCSYMTSDFSEAISVFDSDGFSYGSCGANRNPSFCGETSPEFRGVQRVNFIFSWTILGGMIGGAVLLFIVTPAIVLCVGTYRGKKY